MVYEEKVKILKSSDVNNLSLKKCCEIMSFNRSSYYFEKNVKKLDKKLLSDIEDIYEDKLFYGYRRVLLDLRDKGHKIGKKKVIKLRKEMGLRTIEVYNLDKQGI